MLNTFTSIIHAARRQWCGAGGGLVSWRRQRRKVKYVSHTGVPVCECVSMSDAMFVRDYAIKQPLQGQIDAGTVRMAQGL